MYIAPNSTVVILNDVPLDNNYEHTVYFTSENNQYNYFYGKRKYVKSNQSYRRHTEKSIKIDISFDEMFGCNYMMFRNESYENKWFYAFITDVKYVNNDVTEIVFEIDVLQTYHFDYTLDDCFIERQHGATDLVGDNIVPEPLKIGDYEVNKDGLYVPEPLRKLSLIILSTLKADKTEGFELNKIGNAYTGLNVLAYNEKDFKKAYQYLQDVNNSGKPEALVAVYHAPLGLVGKNAESAISPMTPDSEMPFYEITIDKYNTDHNSPWGNWKPRNKKVYTHPYNHCHVYTPVGDEVVYPYERFYSLAKVAITGNVLPPATAVLLPLGFNGSAQGIPNIEEAITLSGWSQIAYSTDTFKAWLAQTLLPMTAQTAGTLAVNAGLTAVGLANPLSGAVVTGQIIQGVSNQIGEGVREHMRPPKVGGNGNANTIHTATRYLTFIITNRRIRQEEARRIDDFFTRFGYAQKIITTPNRNARQEFTYLKTLGCAITGRIPADDAKKISEIYDKGITWWKNPTNVGYYWVSNPPL